MIHPSKIAGCLMLVIFAVYGYLSNTIQLDFWSAEELFNARTFPQLIAAGGCLVTLIYLAAPERRQLDNAALAFNWLGALCLTGLMLGYAWLLEPLGFILATTVFLAAGYLVLGERRPALVIGASLPVALAFAGIMALLEIHLPAGVLDMISGSQ